MYRTNSEKSIEHIQTMSNLYKSAQEKAPGAPSLTPQNFQIISLHVIQRSESRSGVQLLAITINGVRLYFSPSSLSYNYSYGGTSNNSSATLRTLQLIHVRLPPSNLLHPDEQENPYRPPVAVYGAAQAPPPPTSRPYLIAALENACYCEGLTIAAQQGDSRDDKDFILCMSPDLTRIGSLGQLRQMPQPGPPQHTPWSNNSYGASGPPRPPLTEYGTVLAIAGRTWSIAVVPRSTALLASPLPASPVPVVINELATQFSEPPRQFMILTNAGLSFLIKRRAVDYLKAVIEEVQAEGNVQPIIEFRDR
jgi:nuclear pore complex protein Nup155